MLPGFNDAHVHLLSGGLSLDQVSLTDATTLDAIKETLKAWAEAQPERTLDSRARLALRAVPDGLPTRQMLDQLVPDRPAYLVSYDGHTGWANTAALEAAGITRRDARAGQRRHRARTRARRADWRPRRKRRWR